MKQHQNTPTNIIGTTDADSSKTNNTGSQTKYNYE